MGSSAGLQAAQDIKSVLSANWTAANTDSKTPAFTDGLETYWENLDFGGLDQVYIKIDTEAIQTGLHADSFNHNVALSLEIMTARSATPSAGRAHFQKMVDETMRIIKANARYSGYAKVVLGPCKPRWNKDKQIFIGQLEVDLLKVNTS